MLGSINKLFGKILGNKSDRDIKSLAPLVEKIKAEYAKLSSISNDQLRQMTVDFKSTIRAAYQVEQDKINQLKAEIDHLEDVDKKENLYKEIDELEKKVVDQIEATLLEILPYISIFQVSNTFFRKSQEQNLDLHQHQLHIFVFSWFYK